MKAVVYERHGGPEVLQVREVPAPPARDGHCRVEVHAAALNPKDVLLRRGKLRWVTRARLPCTPGYDFAGRLLDPADGLATGTPVFGMIQAHQGGACAEVISVRPDELARAPDELSMVEAASLPLAALTALQALRDELELRAGQTVLINGASGGVGTLAVQLAASMGARVVGVCSGGNADFVRELGAHRVIDYTRQRLEDERDLDCIFDVYGTFPWRLARRSLGRRGRYCTTIPRPGSILRGALRRVGVHQAALVVVRSRRQDLEVLREQVASGALRPLVDLVVPLDRSAEGHAHLETRRAKGKVVVSIR